MGEEKAERAPGERTHRLVPGGRALAVLSILFLVPVVRTLRARTQKKQRRGLALKRRLVHGH